MTKQQQEEFQSIMIRYNKLFQIKNRSLQEQKEFNQLK